RLVLVVWPGTQHRQRRGIRRFVPQTSHWNLLGIGASRAARSGKADQAETGACVAGAADGVSADDGGRTRYVVLRVARSRVGVAGAARRGDARTHLLST